MNATDRLVALRPTDATVDRLWDPAARAAVLEGVLATDLARATGATGAPAHPPRALRRRPRRRVTLALAAAAVAVVGVVASLVLPSGAPGGASPAAAAELTRLAAVAATASVDTAGPDQLVHLVIVERQTGDDAPENASGQDRARTLESWTAADGTVWRRDVEATGTVQYYRFAAGVDDTANPSPAFLASLPTDPDALRAYLRANVSGSGSTDAAVFTAVGDMLRGGFAPAPLRAAAIEVLKRTPHVGLGDATTDALGRPALELTFADPKDDEGAWSSLYFAPDTAEILQEADHAPELDYLSIVQTADVADEVPADVLERAAAPANR